MRNQSAVFTNQAGRSYRAGEKGMPDWLFIRYLDGVKPGAGLILWVEMKRPKGGGLSVDQVAWQFKEVYRGALITTVDNFEEFERWYQETFRWLHGPRGHGQQVLDLEEPSSG